MTLRIESWSLSRIAEVVGGELHGSDGHVTSVSSDTRTIGDGALFVALVGERFDGHDYAEQAVEKGAAALLVSRLVDGVDVAQVVVDETLDGLQRLGAALFRQAREEGVFSIALTGSNGKTTTKELIAALWRTRGTVHATAGNLNNHIGVPLTLCAMPANTKTLVLEMGANKFGDIAELIAIAPADVRVITSIGYAHIENLRDLDGVRKVKSEIFEHDEAECLAVVPVAERMLLWLGGFAGRVVSVGANQSGAEVSYKRTARGTLAVRGPHFEHDLNFALPGRHNAQNLATALATLHVLGPDEQPLTGALQPAIDSVELPGGRWRTVERGEWRYLDDAYNANPSSVRASWDGFVEIAGGAFGVAPVEVVAVIGEMLELGDDADELHRETAAWIARRGGAAALAFVGAYAESMAQAARTAIEDSDAEVVALATTDDVAAWLKGRAPGLVYLKASRGQKLERLIELMPD